MVPRREALFCNEAKGSDFEEGWVLRELLVPVLASDFTIPPPKAGPLVCISRWEEL